MKAAIWLSFTVVITLFIFYPLDAAAAETEDLIELDEIENIIIDLDKEYDSILKDFSLQDCFKKIIAGNFEFDIKSLLSCLGQYLTGEIKAFSLTLSEFLFLGIITAVLEVFHRQFLYGKIAETVVTLVFMLIAVKTLGDAMVIGSDSIRHAADLMYGILPLLLGIFAFCGSAVAIGVVQPTILAVIALFIGLTDRFFLPLVMLQGGLTVCSHLNSGFSLRNLSSLVQQLVMLTLGLLMTVFTGVLGLQSFAAGTVDGLALKTLKVATGNFIPVVGGYISEAFDALLGAGLLLRNSIGIFGAGVIGFIIILPCLKLLLMALSLRLTAGLLEPFGCKNYCTALNDFASVILTLFAVVVAAGMLFFFLIICIVAVSNATVMYR